MGIPIVILEIIKYFCNYNYERLKKEGIFRKSASVTTENDLEEKLKNN